MPTHTVERDARGRIARIRGTCDDPDCPVRTVDDDGAETYTCPATDGTLATVPAPDAPGVDPDRRPDTVDDIRGRRRRRR